MIPNAMAKSGPYADLWGHLKSIDHALERTLSGANREKVSELDIDRLRALVELLKGAQVGDSVDQPFAPDQLLFSEFNQSDYGSAIDLKYKFSTVSEFNDFQRSSKKGFNAKLEKLLDDTEEYLTSTSGLVPGEAPTKVFEVLRAIVRSLLSEVEVALQQ